MRLTFTAELWEYGGDASWFFVSVPEDQSDEVRERVGTRRGFRSVRVRATVGGTTWTTSVFPSKERVFLLPVKKAVRRAEGLEPGEPVDVTLEVLDVDRP